MGDQGKTLILYWGRHGAGALIALLLTRRLIESGFGARIVLSLSNQNELIDEFRSLPIALESGDTFASTPTVGNLLWRSQHFARRIRGEMNRHRPSTVFIPMLFGAALPILPWLRSHGARFVYGVHDIQQHAGERTGLEQAAAQFGLIRMATRLVALSEGMKADLVKRYPRLATRITVEPLAGIYEGTATTRDFPSGRVLRLLVPGRLVRYKGFERLAQALRLLGPEICRVTITGDGPERGRVAELFGSLPNVDLRLGWMPESERQRLFAEHDILVCAHDEASQSGLICEALTRAMPSVVTPVGALPEQIGFGQAGWIARDMSPAALADVVTQISRDPIGYRTASLQCAAVLQRARLACTWAKTLGLA